MLFVTYHFQFLDYTLCFVKPRQSLYIIKHHILYPGIKLNMLYKVLKWTEFINFKTRFSLVPLKTKLTRINSFDYFITGMVLTVQPWCMKSCNSLVEVSVWFFPISEFFPLGYSVIGLNTFFITVMAFYEASDCITQDVSWIWFTKMSQWLQGKDSEWPQWTPM